MELSSLDSATGLRRGSAELARGPPPPAVLLRDTGAADDRVRRRRGGDGDSMDFGEADADGEAQWVVTVDSEAVCSSYSAAERLLAKPDRNITQAAL